MGRATGLALGLIAAVLIVALLILAVIGEGERSGDEAETAGPPTTVTAESSNARLEVTLAPPHAKVSEVVMVTGKIVNASTGAAIEQAEFQVVSVHVEDDLAVFDSTVGASEGTFTWGVQFWDGAEHELRITARPAPGASVQFAPVTLQHLVEVEGVAPPLWGQIRATLYLVAVAAVGLVIGIPLGARVRGTLARPRRPARESA